MLLYFFLLVTSEEVFNRVLGCSITTKYPTVTEHKSSSVKLKWIVTRPYNKILSSVECKRSTTLIADGVGKRFALSKFMTDQSILNRIYVSYSNNTYTIEIRNLIVKDTDEYECSILCVSTTGVYTTRTISLDVKDGEVNIPKQTETKPTEQPTIEDKKSKLYIWIGVIAAILFILILTTVFLCRKKKLYRFSFKAASKKPHQQVTLLQEPKSGKFEEQKYADLTEHQKDTYTDLDLKLALWPSHEYEYVKAVRTTSHKKRNTSLISDTYEYIDPNFTSKKEYV